MIIILSRVIPTIKFVKFINLIHVKIFSMLDHILDMPYEYLLNTIRFANEGAKPYSFLIISFRLVNKLLMVIITKMDNFFFQVCYA